MRLPSWTFSTFSIHLRVIKCHTNSSHLKLEYAKEFINISNISFSICHRTAPILPIAFSWLFAFLQIADTYFLKFNLLSISIPKSVTDSLDFISAFFMVRQQLWFDLSCLFIVIAWSFLGFNQLIRIYILINWDLQSYCYYGIRKTPTRKIPTWNIPTHAFKHSHPSFLFFYFCFHYCHRHHWHYLKDCFVIVF